MAACGEFEKEAMCLQLPPQQLLQHPHVCCVNPAPRAAFVMYTEDKLQFDLFFLLE